MNTNKKTPKLRFKGFTDDWEQRKFGEIMTFLNGRAYKQDELLGDGKYKVLRVGNFYTNDSWYYSNLELDDKFYATNGDLLYTWSATFGPHIWKGEKVIYHYHIWKLVLQDKIDKLFALQLLEVDKANIMSDKNGSTMVHITKQGMENKQTILPINLNEQKKIAKFLSSMDKLITLHQRKLEKLKLNKSALLQKLFSQNGCTTPEVRFKGFTDVWGQRKLIYIFNDFIVPMRDKPKVFSGTTPWTRIEDIEGRYINTSLSGQFVSDETIKSMNLKVIPKGSLIVSASATFGVVAIVNNDLITNQTFIGLVPNKDFDIDFLYSLFEAPTTKGKLLKLSAGSTIFYIARESFENLVLSVPSKEEQIKISKVFKSIDDSITLHQRKLDRLISIKKALLQQLFV